MGIAETETIQAQPRLKPGPKPGSKQRGHVWTPEEARAHAMEGARASIASRQASSLNQKADEVAEQVLTWAKGILADKKASKSDLERAIRAITPMVSRRVTAREEQTQLDAKAEARIAELEAMLLGAWEAKT